MKFLFLLLPLFGFSQEFYKLDLKQDIALDYFKESDSYEFSSQFTHSRNKSYFCDINLKSNTAGIVKKGEFFISSDIQSSPIKKTFVRVISAKLDSDVILKIICQRKSRLKRKVDSAFVKKAFKDFIRLY